MKKFMTSIKTLAALLMAGAAFSACSSSDDNIANEQPANPTQPQVYTMVIKASKGGDATTRALQPGYDDVLGKNTVDVYWSGDETIEVYQSGVKIGEATAAPSANGNTTVTATLTKAPVPSNDLNFYLGGYNNVYTGQNGLLTGTNSISEKYDYAESLIYSNAYSVEGYNVIPGEYTTLNFTDGITKQAIIKFTLKDKGNSDAAISPTALTVTDGTSTVELTDIPEATYTANGGAGVLYVAFPATGGAETITLTATVGSDTYTYTTPSAKTFVNGKYYEITVKMTRVTYPITLSEVTSAYVGSVVTTDGTVYATKADAIAAEKTAAGMIAYVSGIGQGLAIALADEAGEMNWSTAKSTCEAKTPAFTGGTWKLPTKDEWNQMFSAIGGSEGSYTGLNNALAAAGGDSSKLQEGARYWSSSENSPGVDAYRVDLYGGLASWDSDVEGYGFLVRACLAFGSARGHALASSAVGEIVGSDGLAYYASDKDNLPSGVTAVAMIAYVGTASDCAHGLAIALADESGEKNYGAAGTACSGKAAVTGGTWRLPSEKDWQYMFIGCGSGELYIAPNPGTSKSYSELASKLTTAQGEALAGYYWSSTEFVPGTSAWNVNFVGGSAGFNYYNENIEMQVRACLAF